MRAHCEDCRKDFLIAFSCNRFILMQGQIPLTLKNPLTHHIGRTIAIRPIGKIDVFQKTIQEWNVLDMPESPRTENTVYLGIDLGAHTLAAISSGKLFGGGKIRHERDKFLAKRRRLQSNG